MLDILYRQSSDVYKYAACVLIDLLELVNSDIGSLSSEILGICLQLSLLDTHAQLKDTLAIRRDAGLEFLGTLKGKFRLPAYSSRVKVYRISLRPYQEEGVSWLMFLKQFGLSGMLCDDMGLGKTIQALIAVAEAHLDSPNATSLIICPASVTAHWNKEIALYFDEETLNSETYNGQTFRKKVLILSYSQVKKYFNHLCSNEFLYLILDEGHIIKNSKTKLTTCIKMLRSKYRLILSGTPIHNNVIELWSFFDFLMPGFLGSETQFNKIYRQALKPKNTGKDIQFRDQELAFSRLDQLHKQVLPFILRRLKKDVLKELPDKIIQDYICTLSDTQKRMFEDYSINIQVSNSFQDYNFLRKLLNHPKLIDSQLKLDIEEVPKLLALKDLLISCEIAEEFGGSHKALIFSQKKRMLDIIQEELLQKYFPTVKFLRIDGSTRPGERVHIADTFNTNPYLKLLLLTTKVGGLGLNLTGADVVIFIDHDWNPINDLQAMDRAHRLGQDRVVNVYRLITENTLEERILGLQAFKTSISSHLISTENASLSSIDTTSLLSDLANIRK